LSLDNSLNFNTFIGLEGLPECESQNWCWDHRC